MDFVRVNKPHWRKFPREMHTALHTNHITFQARLLLHSILVQAIMIMTQLQCGYFRGMKCQLKLSSRTKVTTLTSLWYSMNRLNISFRWIIINIIAWFNTCSSIVSHTHIHAHTHSLCDSECNLYIKMVYN